MTFDSWRLVHRGASAEIAVPQIHAFALVAALVLQAVAAHVTLRGPE